MIECPIHGEFQKTWKQINRGSKCPECTKYYRVPLWKVDEVAQQQGYKRVGKFAKSNAPLRNAIEHNTTDVLCRLRALVKPWRKEVLQKSRYTCQVTGISSDKLDVHHMTKFIDIVDLTLDSLGFPLLKEVKDYGEERWSKLANLFVKNNKTLSNPVVMLQEIHKRFHMFCGGTDKLCTLKQLEDFKNIILQEMGGEIDGKRKPC